MKKPTIEQRLAEAEARGRYQGIIEGQDQILDKQRTERNIAEAKAFIHLITEANFRPLSLAYMVDGTTMRSFNLTTSTLQCVVAILKDWLNTPSKY